MNGALHPGMDVILTKTTIKCYSSAGTSQLSNNVEDDPRDGGDWQTRQSPHKSSARNECPCGQQLSNESHIELVEGNLNSPDSIRQIFEREKSAGGIWGVYCVLAYPGLGANADGEERQGKMMADLALEYGVSTFVYSSAERGGDENDENEKLSGQAKVAIERHIKSLSGQGLSWTIMRPGFFLDNYEGFIGSITVAVLKSGLKADVSLGVVDSVDIGCVAAAIFRKYKHKELVVIGDVVTMAQQEEIYMRATGRPLPAIPGFLGRMILAMNKATQELVKHFEMVHMARTTGQHENFQAQLQLTREAFPEMKSFHAWALTQKSAPENAGETKAVGWNKISLWRLATGRM
ncbi:NAD(P)-binding protein [Phlebopus sp. FC_14]|nr:NAD(P)-binding protein [Phlebopus sp. FC_14]